MKITRRKPRMPWMIVLVVIVLGFLLLPFAELLVDTPWSTLHLLSGDLGALWTSLLYTLIALGAVAAFGTPLAYWLARHRFRGKLIIEVLLLIPLLTPPLALGILLTSVYGPYSWLGRAAGQLGLQLTNTPSAFVLAQIYASAPYYVIGARAAFEGVPMELEQVARTLGDSALRVFRRITLPLSLLGLGAALAVAWVRALGEFGVVLIMAYYPQGIPVKLWVNLQDVGLASVYPLLWLFFLVGLPLPLAFGLLARRKVWRRQDGPAI